MLWCSPSNGLKLKASKDPLPQLELFWWSLLLETVITQTWIYYYTNINQENNGNLMVFLSHVFGKAWVSFFQKNLRTFEICDVGFSALG